MSNDQISKGGITGLLDAPIRKEKKKKKKKIFLIEPLEFHLVVGLVGDEMKNFPNSKIQNLHPQIEQTNQIQSQDHP